MKHDVTFVTAVYDDLQNTEFAGRHNRGTQYAFSLAQMHSMGAPIFCYTDNLNMHRFFPVLMKYGMDNFNFINYNLDEYPLYPKIQEVKNNKPELYKVPTAWNTRCVEIMWGKFDWLIHTAEQIGLEGDKYLYWIDAGLSHPGVLPKKYNSIYKPNGDVNTAKDYNDRFLNDRIFNDRFPDYLADRTEKDKLFFFFCNNPQHSDVSHLVLPKTSIVGTAVGGLFGGSIKQVYDLAQEAKEICEDLIKNEYLIKEEDILSFILNMKLYKDPGYINEVNMYKFDTWYHEDWLADWNDKLYNPEVNSTFSDFFEDFVNQK